MNWACRNAVLGISFMSQGSVLCKVFLFVTCIGMKKQKSFGKRLFVKTVPRGKIVQMVRNLCTIGKVECQKLF